MKNTIKWIIIAVLLVAVITVAAVLYNKYSDDYTGNNLIESTPTETPAPAESDDSDEDDAAVEFSAPDFTVLDADGNEVKLSDFKGKPIVINFWATWCYYCREEMPDFNQAYKDFPDVQFVMVNATDGTRETMEKAKSYVEQQQFDFDVFYDTELNAVKAYYVSAFPITYFINSDGELVAHGNGMLSYNSLVNGIKMISE